MNEKNLIVEEFIKHALIMERAQFSGDVRKGNKSASILYALRGRFKQEPELAKEVLDELFLNDHTYILYACCTEALLLNYRTEEAAEMLRHIVEKNEKSSAFLAEVALDLYESGELE